MTGTYIVVGFFAFGVATLFVLSHIRSNADIEPEEELLSVKNLAVACHDIINETIDLDYNDLGLRRKVVQKMQDAQTRLRKATREACLGDSGDREYLKEQLKDILGRRIGINRDNINKIIPFDNPDQMSAQDKFLWLYFSFFKVDYHFVLRRMFETFGWNEPKRADGFVTYTVTADDIEAAYQEVLAEGIFDPTNYDSKLDVITQEIYERLYGHNVADVIIADDSMDGVSGGVGGRTRNEYCYLDEIMTEAPGSLATNNNYDMVWCMLSGKLTRLEFLSFGSEEELQRVTENIYRFNSRITLSQINPIVQGTMKDGSRVMVAGPSVSSPTFYVRKFKALGEVPRLDALVTNSNCKFVIELLSCIAQANLNFVVSGPVGGGKTTLLIALIALMNPQFAIRVVESTFEMSLNTRLPQRNIHVMQERDGVTIYDLIRACRRLDTDVVIVSETNEPALASALLQVGQSGSLFVATTIHTNSPEDFIRYCVNAKVEHDHFPDAYLAEAQIASTFNLDIHQARDSEGRHYIEYIAEFQPAMQEEYNDTDDIGITLAKLGRNLTQRKVTEIRTLVHFDHDALVYHADNNISDYTYDLICRRSSVAVADEIRGILANALGQEKDLNTIMEGSSQAQAWASETVATKNQRKWHTTELKKTAGDGNV